jgi:hypothetical protein
MAAFTYHAVTAAGKRIRGSEDSSSAKALASSLGTRGFIVLDVAARQSATESAFGMSRSEKTFRPNLHRINALGLSCAKIHTALGLGMKIGEAINFFLLQ